MTSDLFVRKRTRFVLWRPRHADPAPKLVLGKFQPGNPPQLIAMQEWPLAQTADHPDVWERAAADCNLNPGDVIHYWFEVGDSNPYKARVQTICCTDPLAWTVDWRLLAPRLPVPYTADDQDPAGVVKFADGQLVACDPAGEAPAWNADPPLDQLPPNSRLVIYELPTSWSRSGVQGNAEIDVGTFRDVQALIETNLDGANFAGVCCLAPGRAHIVELGINALELLPPADSWVDRQWGYATSNYFAADHDLGFPKGHASPTPSSDLARLIESCHRQGIRFFADMVMAFATRYSYQNVNFLDFHVQAGANDPEEDARDGFGGDLFKYNYLTESYDPISGQRRSLYPARQLMKLCVERWVRDFRIDGIRLDSIVNMANWDFVRELTEFARARWRERWHAAGHPAAGADERFLVVGEELAVPVALVTERRIDGLWNENFKRMLRYAIQGRNDEKELSFEWTIRKMIDCRLLGFEDGAQAINYVTSHDVEGFRNERLFNFLNNNGIWETERRIKLAFACLLTAVGVPMIFAGEEFADEHDLPVRHPDKQRDTVNFDRVEHDWRRRIFQYVSRLVRFRTTSDALAVNDTEFLHVDFAEGKRVLVWRRGRPGIDRPVVVVANFSDWGTGDPRSSASEYIVPNWPQTPVGTRWIEIAQDRVVPNDWIGREPLYPWEAKVYANVAL